MRHVRLVFGFVIALAAARPAGAVLVGSASIGDGSAALSSTALRLTDVMGTTVADLGVTISGDASGAMRYGRHVYSVDRQGIKRTDVVGGRTSTVRADRFWRQAAAARGLLVVSDSRPSGRGRGSFVYNAATRQQKRFTPNIGPIAAADVNGPKTRLVLLARNRTNKQRLFISGGSLTRLSERSLPALSTMCTAVAVSPDGARVATICRYSSGLTAASVLWMDGQAVQREQKITAYGFTPTVMEWLTDETLIVGGRRSEGLNASQPAMRRYAISDDAIRDAPKVRFTSSAPVSLNDQATAVSQLRRLSPDAFLYTLTYVGTDANDAQRTVLGSAIRRYTVSARKDETIVSDGRLNILPDAATAP